MQHDNKCVCEICNCGNHSCPTNLNPKFDNLSTFKSDYVPHQYDKNPSFKKNEKPFMTSYNPNDLKSIYNQDFDKKNAYNPRVKKQFTPATTHLPFEKNSEYKNCYVPFDAQHKARPITQQSTIQNVPFSNKSVYNQDFQNFDRERPRKQQYNPNKTFQNQNKFQGATTYNNDFHNHPFEPVKQTQFTHRPLNNNNIPFNNSSVYNQSYKGSQNKSDNQCPVTVLPQRPKNCSPGKQHIKYKAQKRVWN